MGVVFFFGFGEHVGLDRFKEGGDVGCEGGEGVSCLGSCISADGNVFSLCEILRTDFNANGNSLQE